MNSARHWLRPASSLKRDDSRQQRAEVFVVADGQRLSLAVLVLGDEQQVNEAQYAPALQPADLGQHPALEVRTGTESDGDDLKGTWHFLTFPRYWRS